MKAPKFALSFSPWFALLLAGLLPSLALAQESAPAPSAISKICKECDAWNAKKEPFRVFGNTYYVGMAGISSVLIATDDGLILLDGGLPQSPALIDESIRALGFDPEKIRLIVTSHEHADHVGGVATLQQATGATVAASPIGAQALQQGGPMPDDPQFGFGRESTAFPTVEKVRVVADGEKQRVGDVSITAHHTPGHTPGSTTWTWRSCQRNNCLDVVYADSLNPASAPGYRFADHPEGVAAFRESIETVRNLDCDILLSVHPGFSGLDEKLQLRKDGGNPEPFIDKKACRAYADAASEALDKRLAEEK